MSSRFAQVWKVIVVLAAMAPACESVCSGADERIAMSQNVILYPAPRQHGSYSLYYDISLTSPGLVSIGVEVLGAEPAANAPSSLLGISLRRRQGEMELRHADFSAEGGTFSYGIDAYELETGRGEYRVVVSNWSLRQTLAIRLVILYPGVDEKEQEQVIMIPGGPF